TESGQRSGNRSEQAGPVIGANNDRAAIALREMLDLDFGPFALELFHQLKMAGDVILRSRQKITIGHRLDESLDPFGVEVLFQLTAHAHLQPAHYRKHVLALQLAFLRFLEKIQRLYVELAQE